ncbi:Trypsin 3A1 [Blattella germanica]|nr:Trypsin 3A1 [Blattella germanica]
MAKLHMMFVTILISTILLHLDKSEARIAHEKNIVNGSIVKIGQYPFMVSLQINNEHWCAGSIINPLYILTAAHCLEDCKNPENYSILVGTVELSDGGTRYSVSALKIHEDYNSDVSYANDIGIVKDGGDVTNELRKVELIVYSDEACLALHEDSPIRHLPVSTNICAGVPEGRKAECNADSGGPVFNKQHQVGIVSWSIKPCGRFPYPGVYTEVSQFKKWIKKNSGSPIKESKMCS